MFMTNMTQGFGDGEKKGLAIYSRFKILVCRYRFMLLRGTLLLSHFYNSIPTTWSVVLSYVVCYGGHFW